MRKGTFTRFLDPLPTIVVKDGGGEFPHRFPDGVVPLTYASRL